jgi:hypothetical protein
MAMSRRLLAFVTVAALIVVPASAGAKKRHSHKPSGVDGVVLNSTCPGACQEPPPPQPVYSGPLTITVQRASDGQQVASQAISDGKFRIRLKRGLYDVSAVPPNPPTCQPTPQTVCPMAQSSPDVIIQPCMQGETKRIQVNRHRFAHVELHVSNTCIV